MTRKSESHPRPDFFIVGAPKCGTTALSEYLRQHDQVFVCDPKEPNFFNRDFNYYGGDPDSIDGYLALFRGATCEHRAIGEASVWYLYSRVAARRIFEFNREARIIAMVRNPIAIATSLHAQLVYTLDEDVKAFERAWDLQERRRAGLKIPATCRQPAFLQYRAVASLSDQLKRFQQFFPERQIRIIVFDDFKSNTREAYRSTLDFLQVPDDGRSKFPRVNESKVHRSESLSRFTQRPPDVLMKLTGKVKRLLGVDRIRVMEKIRAMNRETQRRAPLDPLFLDRLRQAFEPEIASLSALLGRDLSGWLEEDVR